MELSGKWAKEDTYMEFYPSDLQRYYEAIIDQYHYKFNQLLDQYLDEEIATTKARDEGFQMITDYKMINQVEQFATSYRTPNWEMDLWYEIDSKTGKRDYNKGYIQLKKR
jgi:sulfur relay (sulfurtransferase) DsrC/TusE family protein